MSVNRVISTVQRGVRLGLIVAAIAATGAVIAATGAAWAAPSGATQAQAADDDTPPPSVSHPVVEPTAPSAGKALNTALGQLAKDPRNVDALLAAGDAAIALGDNAAALGFFTRADQLAPTSAPASVGKVKAAIAGAHLHLDDPVEALRWYADAQQAGADPVSFAADRGLAYDLVGDNAAAVAQYRVALDHGTDAAWRDEVTRRLALSLAIGGDRRGAERTLLPLLQRQDRAAWRTHTFVLAVAGRSDDAVGVAHATMPPDLADAIAPYLRFMIRLTPAQQAAVASLGRYPRAADIGRDDPRVVAYTAVHPRVVLAPAGATPPVLAKAADSAPVDAGTARSRRRHGGGGAPVAVASAAPAKPDPEIVLPPPPPPPTAVMASAGSAPVAPVAAAVVPRPVVLSRLDMPPPARRTPLVTAQARPVPPPSALVQPVAPPTAPPPASPGPAPASDPAMTSHAVVQPIPATIEKAPDQAPEPAVAKPEAVHPPVAQDVAGKGLAAKARGAKTRDKPAATDAVHAAKDSAVKDSALKDKPADKTSEKAGDKSSHAKTARAKDHAKDDADASLLPPCKPAAPVKGRKGLKGKGARAEPATTTKAGSRHGRKGKPEGKDKDTCAPTARGDRPDGPGGVSRDTDSEDTGKAKNRGKTRADSKGKGSDSEKPAEKGGRHARYASRIWVEVLTGADRDKMPNEWRNLVRKSHALKKHKPYLTPWRSNFRLLTGPFDSDADAQDFIAELRKEGVPGFEWTSPAGQAVDSLPVP